LKKNKKKKINVDDWVHFASKMTASTGAVIVEKAGKGRRDG